MVEETGLECEKPVLFSVKGAPNRDPRYHIVSIVYEVTCKGELKPQAGDDAATCNFYTFKDVVGKNADEFFGDHYEILTEYYNKKIK